MVEWLRLFYYFSKARSLFSNQDFVLSIDLYEWVGIWEAENSGGGMGRKNQQ